jgi:two-component system sensor histidine kinase KdpD
VALVISHLVEGVRRQADERARAEIAAETERIRSMLLASIPYELRTPLALMAGASSKLAEHGVPDATRRALAKIVAAQAREMSEHVAKVLETTGVEPGAIKLERRAASLPDIVSKVLARLHATLAAHRVIVDVQGDLPKVSVDAPLVEQALANLLENCAAHTPAGTVVRVRGERHGDDVLVTVEDYADRLPGTGLEHVTTAFERGAVEGDAEGALGLAIAGAVVRLHGGKAWVERPTAGGTAFRFTLPVDAMPAIPSVRAMPAGNI